MCTRLSLVAGAVGFGATALRAQTADEGALVIRRGTETLVTTTR
jgi:hypothetical protein